MNTSKRTQELAMAFSDPSGTCIRLIYGLLSHKAVPPNREAPNVNNRKPYNLERTVSTFFVVLAEAASHLHVIVSVTSVANF